MQGGGVGGSIQSLVEELRSCKVHNTAEKGRKKKWAHSSTSWSAISAVRPGREVMTMFGTSWWSNFPPFLTEASLCHSVLSWKESRNNKKKSCQTLKTCWDPCWEGRFSNDSEIQGELLLRQPFPFGSKLTLIWWPLDFLPSLTGRSGGWLHLLAFLTWCWTPDGEKGGYSSFPMLPGSWLM